MNVLFLSLMDFNTFEDKNIYTDLMREFIRNGHCVHCVAPVEARKNEETRLLSFGENSILKLKIGNIQKVNVIEKGISTLMIEPQFINGIKKYFSAVKFDLVLYATPPVTFAKVIRFVKKRDGAKSYLMLKDIFPQNSLDLGMLTKSGLRGFLYSFFRQKEKALYALSDRIGCMSPANEAYVKKHNPQLERARVEVCPNCIEAVDLRMSKEEKHTLREKYDLPLDKKIFVYGGNLGRPQDVPFIVSCLKACRDIPDVHFVLAGSGTDRHFLEKYVQEEKPSHVTLFDHLPRQEYDAMTGCCDVGLIFLDHRFTIPNFPSRLLSYLQAGLPVLACTDPNTDVGKVITEGGFGWWCESSSTNAFREMVLQAKEQKLEPMGTAGYEYLLKEYTTRIPYQRISCGMGWSL